MKVRVVGFDLVLHGSITFKQFWDSLSDPHELVWRKQERFLYHGETGGYHVGLLISSKDHRTTCRLAREKGKISIRVHKAEKEEKLADFNVFVIHPTTLRGFYLQYRGSCSIQIFGKFLTSVFAGHVKVKLKEALGETPDSDSKAVKAVKARFREPKLLLAQMIRKGALDELLEKLTPEEFEFDYATLVAHDRGLAPFTGAVKREVVKIYFRTDVTPRSVRSGIVDVVNSLGLITGKVKGRSVSTDIEDTVKLAMNPDVFHIFDYDDIAEEQAFDLDDITRSSLVELLLQVAAEHVKLLSAPAVA